MHSRFCCLCQQLLFHLSNRVAEQEWQMSIWLYIFHSQVGRNPNWTVNLVDNSSSLKCPAVLEHIVRQPSGITRIYSLITCNYRKKCHLIKLIVNTHSRKRVYEYLCLTNNDHPRIYVETKVRINRSLGCKEALQNGTKLQTVSKEIGAYQRIHTQ